MSRKSKDSLQKGAIYLSAGFTVLILAVIIAFIVIKGLPGISWHFLTSDYDDKTTYVAVSTELGASDVTAGEIGELGAVFKGN